MSIYKTYFGKELEIGDKLDVNVGGTWYKCTIEHFGIESKVDPRITVKLSDGQLISLRKASFNLLRTPRKKFGLF